jgi:hypothetical protein
LCGHDSTARDVTVRERQNKQRSLNKKSWEKQSQLNQKEEQLGTFKYHTDGLSHLSGTSKKIFLATNRITRNRNANESEIDGNSSSHKRKHWERRS